MKVNLGSLEKKYFSHFCIFYALTSSIAFTLAGVCSKQLPFVSGPILVYFRSIGTIAINNVFLEHKYDYQTLKESFIWLLLLGVNCSLMSITYNTGVKFIMVSEATIIFETIGIWIALLSIFVFKNVKGNSKLYLSIILSFIGLVLIVRPSSLFKGAEFENQNSHRTYGILTILFSSFFGTAYYVLLKNISGKFTQFEIMHYIALTGCFIAPIYAIFQNEWTDNIQFFDSIFIIGFSVTQYIAHIFLQKALCLGSTVKVTVLGYSEVLFAFIFDIIWFNAQVSLYSVIGLIMLIMGFVLLAFLK